MAKVEVGKGRTLINNLPSGIELIIPSRKNLFLIFFLAFWLVGWGVGEVSAIESIINSKPETPVLFMVAWLGGWTAGGAFAISAWLYNIKGKEVVRIDRLELKHIRDYVIFKRSKEYELAHVKDLRALASSSSMFNFNTGMEFWGFTGGNIAFDYGHNTYKFGTGLDEAEAKHIVETIKHRFKNLEE